MNYEELMKLPVEERAKQEYENKTPKGCLIIIAAFLIVFILFLLNGDLGPLWSLMLSGGIIYGIYYMVSDSKYNNAIKEAKRIGFRTRRENEERQAAQKLSDDKNSYIEKYGTCDNEIKFNDNVDISSYLLVFANSRHLVIGNNDIAFSDIIDMSVQDEQEIKKGKLQATTKTDTGSMIGRSVVGGALMGNAGAVIGGATAKKNTTFIQGNDKILHNFTALIHINNLATPLVSVPIGTDVNVANEIQAVFSAIKANI